MISKTPEKVIEWVPTRSRAILRKVEEMGEAGLHSQDFDWWIHAPEQRYVRDLTGWGGDTPLILSDLGGTAGYENSWIAAAILLAEAGFLSVEVLPGRDSTKPSKTAQCVIYRMTDKGREVLAFDELLKTQGKGAQEDLDPEWRELIKRDRQRAIDCGFDPST